MLRDLQLGKAGHPYRLVIPQGEDMVSVLLIPVHVLDRLPLSLGVELAHLLNEKGLHAAVDPPEGITGVGDPVVAAPAVQLSVEAFNQGLLGALVAQDKGLQAALKFLDRLIRVPDYQDTVLPLVPPGEKFKAQAHFADVGLVPIQFQAANFQKSLQKFQDAVCLRPAAGGDDHIIGKPR